MLHSTSRPSAKDIREDLQPTVRPGCLYTANLSQTRQLKQVSGRNRDLPGRGGRLAKVLLLATITESYFLSRILAPFPFQSEPYQRDRGPI